jgi:hypothetical protein
VSQEGLALLSAGASALHVGELRHRVGSTQARLVTALTGAAGPFASTVLLSNALLRAYTVLSTARLNAATGARFNARFDAGVGAVMAATASGVW